MTKRMMEWRVAAVIAAGLVTAAGAQVTPMANPPYRFAAMPVEEPTGAGQSSSNAPVKDDLFAGTQVFEKNATDVQEITMDPSTLDMVGGSDQHKARNIVLDVVRTYTYDKPGMYNMADVDAIRNRLNTGDWHCPVHTRNLKTGESTDICSKQRTDGLHEEAVITVQPKRLTFIHVIRRANGPGSSDLMVSPFLTGMGPIPMMAMVNPEAFADMQMAMSHLQMLDSAETKTKMDSAMQGLQQLNSVDMQKKWNKAMQQMKEAQKSFKFDQRLFRGEGAKDGQPKQPE